MRVSTFPTTNRFAENSFYSAGTKRFDHSTTHIVLHAPSRLLVSSTLSRQDVAHVHDVADSVVKLRAELHRLLVDDLVELVEVAFLGVAIERASSSE